jgi:protocatechuate 3,4-dioxygenase beta subunit
MNRITPYHLSLFLLMLVSGIASFAQNPAVNKAAATVSGRITIGGQPASGIKALLKKRDDQGNHSGNLQSPASIATTDADGRYWITNLTAGSYRISVHAPAYVIEEESRLSYEYGKTVTVGEGEEIVGVDFSLTRGGVITGKVTDEYGKPVIAEGVGAFRLDRQGKRDKSVSGGMLQWQTDDRGVYRIFGLEPGRYIVGVGASSEDTLQPLGNRGSYRRTYHPSAVDELKATIIEVKPGSEVENVDIKLSRATKSYAASGRVTDAETGKPLPGVMIGCDIAKAAGASFGMGNAMTNSNGEFRIDGLSPNTYSAYVFNPGQSELYSDRVNFEIANGDVDGLEIKMIRGASISGSAIVEGARDPAILAQLSKILLRAEGTSQDTVMLMLMTGGGTGAINSDGTFRIGGVRPGKTRIVALISSEPKGFMFARVERNGVEVNEFNVAQGEQITGVRLVFTYGTSVLAGRVEIKGGAPPPNVQMTVRVVREGVSPEEWWFAKQANVDARGQFSIEGLSQGNYKVHLMIFAPGSDSQPNFPKVEQRVGIPDNALREITLLLDLTKGGDK